MKSVSLFDACLVKLCQTHLITFAVLRRRDFSPMFIGVFSGGVIDVYPR